MHSLCISLVRLSYQDGRLLGPINCHAKDTSKLADYFSMPFLLCLSIKQKGGLVKKIKSDLQTKKRLLLLPHYHIGAKQLSQA